MTPLTARKTRLTFETASTVRERGRYREVVIEAEPAYAVVRLKGTRGRFLVAWDAVYGLAARQAAEQKRREKLARKKAAA
jgi:hypothetical protein